MRLTFFMLICLAFTTVGFAQTQAEMDKQASNSYQEADKELNEVYQRILVEYKTDTAFVKNLKASQHIWISFRDAELKMKYPNREVGYYGSIHLVCVASYLELLTRERIRTLKEWLVGSDEVDACGGSVKIKH